MPDLRVNPEELQVGEYLSEVQYYKIVTVEQKTVTVVNERGFEFTVSKGIIAEGMYSASQYNTEQQVTRTEICEKLEQAGNHIFTVNFHKQVKEKNIQDKLLNAINLEKNSSLTKAAITKMFKQVSKSLLQGEERTLIGYLLKVEPKVGRSTVIDLELSPDTYRVRQVDHRTINWLIIKNVKYLVK